MDILKMMPTAEPRAELLLQAPRQQPLTAPESRFSDLLRRKQPEVRGQEQRAERHEAPKEVRDTGKDADLQRMESRQEQAVVDTDQALQKTDTKDGLDKKDPEAVLKKLRELADKLEKGQSNDTTGSSELQVLLQQINALIEKLEKKQGDSSEGKMDNLLLQGKGKAVKGPAAKTQKQLAPALQKEVESILTTIRKLLGRKEAVKGKGTVQDELPLETLKKSVEQAIGKDKAVERPELVVKGRSTLRKVANGETRSAEIRQKAQAADPVEWKGSVRKASAESGQHNITRDDANGKTPDIRQTARTGQSAGMDAAGTRKIFNQIVERARVTHKSGMSEMRLQLKPESLGRVRMHLTLKDGAVSARLTVANAEVRQLVMDNLDALGREMREMGINLADLDVAQQGQDERFRRNMEEAGNNTAFLRSSGIQTAGEAGPAAPVRGVAHAGQVDIVA